MGRTVLVVDDDAATTLLLKETFTREGFTVLTASNGAEGLAMVASHAPEVVVLDLEMPVMSGIEVLRSLRQNQATRFLPVIVLTGQTDRGHMVEAWMSGAERYVKKPASPEALVAEVKRLLPSPEPE